MDVHREALARIPTAPPPSDPPPPGEAPAMAMSARILAAPVDAGARGAFPRPPPVSAKARGFGVDEVWRAWRNTLLWVGITSREDLHRRARHCGADESEWVMLLLDKIHHVDRPGSACPDADPVALTVSGWRHAHTPTESARQWFDEVMADARLAAAAGAAHARRFGVVTRQHVTLELGRRKGRRRAVG